MVANCEAGSLQVFGRLGFVFLAAPSRGAAEIQVLAIALAGVLKALSTVDCSAADFCTDVVVNNSLHVLHQLDG